MFAASDWILYKDGSTFSAWKAAPGEPSLLEHSAAHHGWLLPEETQVDRNAHPHDPTDHPRGCPDFDDREQIQNPDDVLAREAKGGHLDTGGVSAPWLKKLKRSGVNLIPFRAVCAIANLGSLPPVGKDPKPYADYIKRQIFEGHGVDLVVADYLSTQGKATPDSIAAQWGVDLMGGFFPLLNAKKTVHWLGCMAHLYGGMTTMDNTAAVLVATFIPNLHAVPNDFFQAAKGPRYFFTKGVGALGKAPFFSLRANGKHQEQKDLSPVGLVTLQHSPESKGKRNRCPPPSTKVKRRKNLLSWR